MKRLESRHGASNTEYIVILCLILGIAMFLIWNRLGLTLEGAMESVGTGVLSSGNEEQTTQAKKGASKGKASGLFGGSTGSGGSGGISYGSSVVGSSRTYP